ncbi:helix-turn-helix domain-containing protein [Streptomyces microflavus]|uniref:IclR family transcriptional regulator domain-containing protein n=1 Tax=Streptomyces microflavus TaxID=1919 RepID=UPI0029AB744F|nr:IclR family transcriptional regulator C-terminal domain-containing protein [Streptomyces microflavus]MDX2406770.1 helix-turn-helix domain-containing protein [Streptomyces microflavus]
MTDEARRSPRDTDFVQSLARGLAVVNAFDAEHPRMSLSQVARAVGMAPATARRFLLTLTQLGYVEHEDGRYRLRARVLDLGYRYLSRLSVRDVAEPHLEQLAAEVHESSSLSILDGDDIVYVARVSISRIVAIGIGLGTRLPAHLTSMGRVLLAGLPEHELRSYLDRVTLTGRTGHSITEPESLRAELDRVRKQGWAVVDQELDEGLCAVAVPVRSRLGTTFAAVNIATHAGGASHEDIRRRLLPPLLSTAARIEADLHSYPVETPAPLREGGTRG